MLHSSGESLKLMTARCSCLSSGRYEPSFVTLCSSNVCVLRHFVFVRLLTLSCSSIFWNWQPPLRASVVSSVAYGRGVPTMGICSGLNPVPSGLVMEMTSAVRGVFGCCDPPVVSRHQRLLRPLFLCRRHAGTSHSRVAELPRR